MHSCHSIKNEHNFGLKPISGPGEADQCNVVTSVYVQPKSKVRLCQRNEYQKYNTLETLKKSIINV